jgi:hypothetical protein
MQNLLLESSPGPSGTEELRSAVDILFDYLDPEEGRIYNDLARCINSLAIRRSRCLVFSLSSSAKRFC